MTVELLKNKDDFVLNIRTSTNRTHLVFSLLIFTIHIGVPLLILFRQPQPQSFTCLDKIKIP